MLTMGGSPGALTFLNVDQYEFQGMKMHSAPNCMLQQKVGPTLKEYGSAYAC